MRIFFFWENATNEELIQEQETDTPKVSPFMVLVQFKRSWILQLLALEFESFHSF